MINRRTFLTATGGLALANSFPPLIRLAHAETQTAITFGPPLPVYALCFVAKEKGFCKEECLEFKYVNTDAGARSRDMVAAGEAQLAHGDASHPLQLNG